MPFPVRVQACRFSPLLGFIEVTMQDRAAVSLLLVSGGFGGKELLNKRGLRVD